MSRTGLDVSCICDNGDEDAVTHTCKGKLQQIINTRPELSHFKRLQRLYRPLDYYIYVVSVKPALPPLDALGRKVVVTSDNASLGVIYYN